MDLLLTIAQVAARTGLSADTLRYYERIGLLAPRIAQTPPQQRDDAARAALRELRVGADIAVLQTQRAAGHAPGARLLLAGIARGFRQWSDHGPSAWPDALRRALDRALLRAMRPAADAVDPAALVTALVGLRRNLFPQAPRTLGAPVQEPAA